MMRRISPRQTKRMMRQMGMKMEELAGVEEVIFRLADKELVVESPSVTALEVQGQRMFQVTGERVVERALAFAAGAPEPSPEDIQLLVAQTGVSPNEAKRALQDAGGNLAEALLALQGKARS